MCLRALGTNPLCAKSVRGKEVYMIITIARQCGCMGDQIGKALAEKYFIPFYDKDAVCRLAKEKGLYEKYPYFSYNSNILSHNVKPCFLYTAAASHNAIVATIPSLSLA